MWNLSSRVQKLHHFPNNQVSCYVKRDDELGCGINGSKLRKYAGLVPFLQKESFEHLIIIAGAQSNNLLAALQIARELQLKVTVFLIKPHHSTPRGNYKLSCLFMNEDEVVWIERDQWFQVENLARAHMSTLKERVFLITEGASVPQALNGAMTLADDIVRNEHELSIKFQHIFIDSGTGFTAAGLIKRLNQLEHDAFVHVLLLADDEIIFKNKLREWAGLKAKNYRCFYPKTAKSFGSVNRSILDEIKRMAREEGILADPIYSGKLFLESREYIIQEQLQGNILIIHSGGALTLAGYDL